MKILALNGLLGYGYTEQYLQEAFADPPDYVGVDAGSSDPGPYYLGSGHSFTDRLAVKRDLAFALPLALATKAPLIIGTAGGAGSRPHVQWLKKILDEVVEEQQLSFRLAVIYTDVSKSMVQQKLKDGQIIPMGHLELTEKTLAETGPIVSQIGSGPIVEALSQGVDVVLAGRACDTAIYAAPCLLHGYDPGLAYHMAKIMECGALCAVPAAAAEPLMAHMGKDYFDLTPVHPQQACTVSSVAAHTLYEQPDPNTIVEPEGTVDLTSSQYQQINARTVRIRGSRFQPADKLTLKLEGVRQAGYRTLCLAGINDPLTIQYLDTLFQGALTFVRQNLTGRIEPHDYSVSLQRLGHCGAGSPAADLSAHALGLVIDVVGKSQQIADTVCALLRSRMLHYDYPGRKSTAGNLAFFHSPSDLSAGKVYTFSIYHLMQTDDLGITAAIHYEQVGDDL